MTLYPCLGWGKEKSSDFSLLSRKNRNFGGVREIRTLARFLDAYSPVSGRSQKSKSRGNGTGSVYRVGKSWAAAVTAGYKIELVDGVPKSTAIRRKKQGFKTKKEEISLMSFVFLKIQ